MSDTIKVEMVVHDGDRSVKEPYLPGELVIPSGTANRSAAIAEAAEAFHEAVFDLDVLLHIVAERISRATGDYCSVALVSPDGRRFQPLVAYHADPMLIEDSRQFLGVSMDVDAAGPWARVLRERRTVVIAIDPDHLPPEMAPHQKLHIQRWRMREAILIPLIARDKVVGGLNLNRLEGGQPFTPEDIDLLESLGVLAARAIANARLLQAHKQTEGDLERQVQARTREAEARALEARAAVARLQGTLNTPLSTIVIATDSHGVITLFNSGAEQLLGYKAHEVIGTATPMLFMSPHDTESKAVAFGIEPGFPALARRYSTSGATDEWVLLARSGGERPVDLSISPIGDPDRSRLGFVLIARDISERKALEADLRAALAEGREAVTPAVARREEVGELARSLAGWERFSRQRLEGAQAMAELSSLTNVEDVTRVGLQKIGAIFGARHGFVALAEAQGVRVAAVLHPDEAQAIRMGTQLDPGTPEASALATAAPVLGDLTAEIWSEAVANWAPIEPGPLMVLPLVSQARVVGTVTLIRGRTDEPFSTDEVELARTLVAPLAASLEVSRLVAELRRTNADLIEANLHKSQFLANMSHELRTPLSAIIGFSELLIDDVTRHFDAATRIRFLEQIQSGGQHLLGLINDILDLSKVEAGQMELHFAKTSVAETIDLAVTIVGPLATKNKVTIVSQAARDLYLVADPGKLKQMLLNLIGNGIKFTRAGGQVTIAARRDDSMIEFLVTDTGVGMSEADLGLIFQEFKQLEQGSARKQEGTGLGLALTKRFAELHGGTVSVQSSKDIGSTFTLRLPIEAREVKFEPTPEIAPVDPTDVSRPLVLVVDDNPQASELLARHLAGGGFRVAIARTGTEALTMARELKPLAVTLDILLPEIDGWEVLTRLKQDTTTRDIPVVIASMVDQPGLGRALGALDYFVKPVDSQALLARLGQLPFAKRVEGDAIRILLVDDEPANLDYLGSVLEPAGFTVLRASGGQEGIDRARASKPDLVLLDLMMPHVSGFDVVEAIRRDESTRSIPIMILTSKELTDEDKKQLNGSVAAVFERKSLAGPELIAWLHQLVG